MTSSEAWGLPGSDSLMRVEGTERATVVSVGIEPEGAPDGVIAVKGGPAAFVAPLHDQHERRLAMEPPRVDEQPGWLRAPHPRASSHPRHAGTDGHSLNWGELAARPDSRPATHIPCTFAVIDVAHAPAVTVPAAGHRRNSTVRFVDVDDRSELIGSWMSALAPVARVQALLPGLA